MGKGRHNILTFLLACVLKYCHFPAPRPLMCSRFSSVWDTRSPHRMQWFPLLTHKSPLDVQASARTLSVWWGKQVFDPPESSNTCRGQEATKQCHFNKWATIEISIWTLFTLFYTSADKATLKPISRQKRRKIKILIHPTHSQKSLFFTKSPSEYLSGTVFCQPILFLLSMQWHPDTGFLQVKDSARTPVMDTIVNQWINGKCYHNSRKRCGYFKNEPPTIQANRKKS